MKFRQIFIITAILSFNCLTLWGQGQVERQPKSKKTENKVSGTQKPMSWKNKYDIVEKRNNGDFLVSKNNKWGIVDYFNHNLELIPCNYSKIGPNDGRYTFIYNNSLCGVFYDYNDHDSGHHQYDIILEPKYKGIKIPYSHWGGNLFVVLTNDNHVKALHVSKELKSIILDDVIGYDDLNWHKIPWNYKHNTWSFRINGKWGLIGDNISDYLKFGYDDVSLCENSIILCINSMYGVIDYEENTILNFEHQYIGYSVSYNNKEFFPAMRNNKWGIIDINGKIIIPFEYKSLKWQFGKTPICVQKEGKYGYVNLKNEIVIPFEFDEASIFYLDHGYKATVKKNGEKFYIDEYGSKLEK